MFKEQILEPIVKNLSDRPDNNAFCIKGKFYTYGDLRKKVINIRGLLKQRPINNHHIGLVTNNDLETYASIIALWMDGYCYVPLHIKQPIDRCNDIIEQVGIDTILDSSKHTRYNENMVVDTKTNSSINSDLVYRDDIDENDLAYILFTSGSTGKPKGVSLTRNNIGSFMDSFWATGIKLGAEDKCLQCFDLTFDVSVQCYLAALISGACAFTVPYGEGKYLAVAGLQEEYNLSFAVMAPSMLRYMMPFFDQLDMSSLKACILTAEACPRDLLESAYKYCPNVDLYDFYGPTETTIYCTFYKLSRNKKNKELNGIISIGKPLKHCIGLILDDKFNELPNGEKGELCIAGTQVTKGYWNNPEKNKTSFFYLDYKGERMRFYHTGDLCYKDSDDDIMYSGRMDNQVKIQGFRVELGEIEHHARVLLNKNLVCLAIEREGINHLYLVIEGSQFDTKPLVEYMRSKMPHYMVPEEIVFLDRFPLNNSDKVDRPSIKKMLQ